MPIEIITEMEILNTNKVKLKDLYGSTFCFGQEISNGKIIIREIILEILWKRNYELSLWDVNYKFDDCNREYKVILNKRLAKNVT